MRSSLLLEQELGLIRDVAELVARDAVRDLQAVLARITEAAASGTASPGITAFLFNYALDEVYASSEGARAVVRSVGETRSGFSLLPEQATRLALEAVSAQGDRGQVHHMPLVSGAQTLGILGLCSSGTGPIGADDRRLLGILATYASLAIVTSTRLGEAERFSKALSDLYEASQTFGAGGSPEHLRQTIVESALAISRADFVVLYEFFKETGDVRLPPAVAGPVKAPEVQRERGIALPHRASVIFKMIDRRAPFYAEEAPADWQAEGLLESPRPGEPSFFAREEVVSSCGIPLRIDAEPMGVLFANYRRRIHFEEKLKEQITTFANQAALALGNARFHQRSQRFSRDLAVLNEIGQKLGSAATLDIREIARLIHEQTSRVVEAQNFFICLYDQDEERYSLPYVEDERDRTEELQERLSRGLTGYVVRTMKPQILSREEQERLFTEGEAELVGTQSHIWLGAPMIARNHVQGAIVVQSYDPEVVYTREHLNLLMTIASQAAVAIDNYHLLQATERRLRELSALVEISQTFSSQPLSLRQLLSLILERLCDLVGCEGGLLCLREPGRDHLTVAAASPQLAALLRRPMTIGEGLIGRVAATGKWLIVNDYDAWEGRVDALDLDHLGFSLARVVGVPLLWKGEVEGVMTLASSAPSQPFTLRDVELLERFVGHAAIAIHNARNSSFLRALIEGGPNAIVAIDTRGAITEFNEAATEILGHRSEEIIGKEVYSLYWKGYGEARRIRALLDQSKKISYETFLRSGRGDKIPIHLSAALLRDEDGEVLGSVGIVEDLRLMALRGRARSLVDAVERINACEGLDAIAEAIVLHSADLLGADASCLLLKAEDSFGVQSSIGCDGERLAALADAHAQEKLLEVATAAGPIAQLLAPGDETLRLAAASRSSAWVPIRGEARLLGVLLLESGETGHFGADLEVLQVLASQAAVAVNRAQLLEEQETTRRKLLQYANAIAVGQIGTIFIHEAKNALHAMTMTISNVGDAIGKIAELKGKEKLLKKLAGVETEIGRVDSLSRRLQKFTKQGLKPEKTEVYVNPLVSATLELLASALEEKKIHAVPRLDPRLDRPSTGRGNPVHIDEQQIQQVLMNLFLNAIAASRERGRIHVETLHHPREVEIKITDEGRGIREEERGRIFEPFFTTKSEGTGLGLYISRMLVVENHGGRIQIGSSGKGSCFSVLLPNQE